MPLEVLGILVVVGLALVISTVHFSGKTDVGNTITHEGAKRIIGRDFPDYNPGTVFVSEDASSAVVFSDTSKGVGLVCRVGSKSITRRLDMDLLKKLENTGREITLVLNDFTLPVATLKLADPETAEAVQAQIGERLTG